MPIDYSKYPKNWKTEIRPAMEDGFMYRVVMSDAERAAVRKGTLK